MRPPARQFGMLQTNSPLPCLPQAPTAAATEISAASGAIINATLAEADRRAASLKFEVGPPPRNVTRGREGF